MFKMSVVLNLSVSTE